MILRQRPLSTIYDNVLPSASSKTACKSLRVTYVRTVTRLHVLETPPWSSEFGKCHKCHSWEPTVAQSKHFPNFMVPKDMLSFPQVTAKPDFYTMFCYMICVVTAMISRPPSPAYKSVVYRSSVVRNSYFNIPCSQLPLKFGGCVVTSVVFPAAVSVWLICIWSGEKPVSRRRLISADAIRGKSQYHCAIYAQTLKESGCLPRRWKKCVSLDGECVGGVMYTYD